VPISRFAYFAPLLFLLCCTTKKNTFVTRSFHNITTRYNGYYYSNENIDEGVYKIQKNHKENYDRVLPVFIYPNPEEAKNTFPEFDKAIKKSSLAIQRHTIKDKKGAEIPTAGRWIDNNWINIGVAHFYKREFFSAIESFEYVIRTYRKSEDKYRAMIWLIKANNEIGAVSSSEPIISLLKNEKGLPLDVTNELPVVMADYYLRRGQNTEAIAKLTQATKNTNLFRGISKSKRARYTFIIAQLSELTGEPKKAIQYYKRTIKLKPSYEMVFYSKIKTARLLDVKRMNSEKTKKDLLKMAKEFKNSDYYDVIYYTLGVISEKEKNIDQAVTYYKKSVQTSLINPNQKSLSFLKLGEINFDRALYKPAEAYYDSALATLPKDHPDFDNIVARKKTLKSLVGYINTIAREDSLQRVAKLSPPLRQQYIEKIIEQYKKDEERRKAELKAAMDAPAPGFSNTLTPSAPPGMAMGGQATFYFYNPNTVALGVADFQRKWGNRKLEDHWRRSNKAVTIEEDAPQKKDTSKTEGKTKVDPLTTIDYYLKDLPLTDSAISKSNTKIINAFYYKGILYKEELNNVPKSVAAFEELNRRYPHNQYELNTYYMQYRMYQAARDQPNADKYKNKILNEYPESEFAQLIKNPEFAETMNAEKSEVEKFYGGTYDAYKASNYSEAYSKARQGLSQYGKSDFADKFEFIKAMSLGKLKGIDTLEQQLKMMVAKYPSSEVTPLANDVLASIKNYKSPVKLKENTPSQMPNDTFTVNFDAEHYIFAIVPDNKKFVDAFTTSVNNFNTLFYTSKKISLTANLFGKDKQIILFKAFPNGKEALSYYENLMADNDVFTGEVKKDMIEMYPILPSNIAFLYQKKSAESYKLFYADQFKKLKASN
jgi:tetratricopeptide (TPR) repeat protein